MSIKNGEIVKQIFLKGFAPLVRCVNKEIITAAQSGIVNVLNLNLDIIETYEDSSVNFGVNTMNINTLAANKKYIAFGTSNGEVQYYSRQEGHRSKVRTSMYINETPDN